MNEEEYKYQCLVRHVIKMRIKDRSKAWAWLKGHIGEDGKWVKGWNDLHPESNLYQDVVDQWNKGNRGNENEWK